MITVELITSSHFCQNFNLNKKVERNLFRNYFNEVLGNCNRASFDLFYLNMILSTDEEERPEINQESKVLSKDKSTPDSPTRPSPGSIGQTSPDRTSEGLICPMKREGIYSPEINAQKLKHSKQFENPSWLQRNNHGNPPPAYPYLALSFHRLRQLHLEAASKKQGYGHSPRIFGHPSVPLLPQTISPLPTCPSLVNPSMLSPTFQRTSSDALVSPRIDYSYGAQPSSISPQGTLRHVRAVFNTMESEHWQRARR